MTQVDRVATDVVANDWAVDDSRFPLYPALKELTSTSPRWCSWGA